MQVIFFKAQCIKDFRTFLILGIFKNLVALRLSFARKPLQDCKRTVK